MFTQAEEKFIQSLDYPDNAWQDEPFILCVTAAIGSGKSTVMEKLSARLGLVRFRSDSMRVILKEMGVSYTAEELSSRLKAVFIQLVSEGHSIALDANAGSAKTIALMKELESTYGTKTIWLTFDISEEEAERRIAGRDQMIHANPQAAIEERQEQIAAGECNSTLHPPVYIFTEHESLEVQLVASERAIRNNLQS